MKIKKVRLIMQKLLSSHNQKKNVSIGCVKILDRLLLVKEKYLSEKEKSKFDLLCCKKNGF